VQQVHFDVLRVDERLGAGFRLDDFTEVNTPVVEYFRLSIKDDGCAGDGARLALRAFSSFNLTDGEIALNSSDFSFLCIHISVLFNCR
jgi:hypothetical protein